MCVGKFVGGGKMNVWNNRLAAIPAFPALCLMGCTVDPIVPVAAPDPVKTAARSLTIVRSASAQDPKVLKVLFYGQSISSPKWTVPALQKLRRRYPNVTFDTRNLALGGWSAIELERAVLRDVSDFYPDLIVFHVYGDDKAYERIIRTMRSHTAADIIIQTDHVVEPVEPLCNEGFHLRWTPPPGCKGHIRFTQNVWSEYMSGIWLPTLAQRYDLSVEPRRKRWDQYLKAHKLEPKALLVDNPHPNDKGWALMSNLFVSWLETLVSRAEIVTPIEPNKVRNLALPKAGQKLRYQIEGNRIEIIAAGPLNGKIDVTIDGKQPEHLNGCWINSRVSPLPNVRDWPAIKQVDVMPGYHKPDRWTVRVTNLSPAQDVFRFTVESTIGGKDGAGSSDQTFNSPSGRVTLVSGDWNLAYARTTSGEGVAEGTAFTWSRDFVCADQPANKLANGEIEQRHVLATGIANAPHIVELSVRPGAPEIKELRVYRPPLKL